MTVAKTGTAAKKAVAAKTDPVDALRKAVEAARKAGLEVKVLVTKNDEGVTTTEAL